MVVGHIAAVDAFIANQGDIAKFSVDRAGIVRQDGQGRRRGVLAGDNGKRRQQSDNSQQTQRPEHGFMEQRFGDGIARADKFEIGRAQRKHNPPDRLDKADGKQRTDDGDEWKKSAALRIWNERAPVKDTQRQRRQDAQQQQQMTQFVAGISKIADGQKL